MYKFSVMTVGVDDDCGGDDSGHDGSVMVEF